MFEHLQEQRRGGRSKERMRLWVTAGAALVLGTAIYGGKSGCADEADRTTPVAVDKAKRERERDKGPVAREFDRTPLLPLAERTGPADDFDAQALDYVVSEVQGGQISREPWKILTPAEVAAADPKLAIGRMIETRGFVRSLDREERDLPGTAKGTGRLWAFALEGDDGTQIVVVHPGSSQELDEKRPNAAFRQPGSGSGTKLKDGDLVQVRGIYLQRRTGPIAKVTLGEPTPVLVGREYRFTESPNPPLESPEQADFKKIQDRFLGGMRSPESDAAKQIVQWAQTVGHDEIVRRLRSGELSSTPWRGQEFGRWRTEMNAEKDSNQPDRRTWAPAQRGKVFWTPGLVQDFLREGWDQLPPNAFGVDRRWKLYMLSDYDGYLPLVFDSPFPVTAFPGITGHPKQRAIAYGVYVQTHSFEVGSSARKGSVESPFFVLLDLQPVEPPSGTPLLENPFFWTWISLGVFGLAFFVVMSRIERKETSAMQAQQLRHKRRRRELGVEKVGPPEPPPDRPSGGGAAPKAPSPPADTDRPETS